MHDAHGVGINLLLNFENISLSIHQVIGLTMRPVNVNNMITIIGFSICLKVRPLVNECICIATGISKKFLLCMQRVF